MKIKIGQIGITAWVETHKTVEYLRKGVKVKRKVRLKNPIAVWGSSFDINVDEFLLF